MSRVSVIFLAMTFGAAACSSPQTAGPAGSSNRGTAEIALGATQVSINYGRPQLQGRDMLSQLQDGQVWRLGMNDATALATSSDLTFGETVIPAGRHSIWAKKVTSTDWRLIFNSETDISGLDRRPEYDFAEIPLENSDLSESVEQFTIELNPVVEGGAEILMKWATLQLRGVFNSSE